MADRYVCIKPTGYTLDGSESSRYSAEYTSMSAMHASEAADLTDDLYVDIIHGDATYNWDASPDTTGVIFDGWDDNSGANKVIIRTLTSAQSANSTVSRPDFSSGAVDTSEYLLKTNGKPLDIDNDANAAKDLSIKFIGVQFEQHTASAEVCLLRGGQYLTSVEFEGCWLKQSNTVNRGIYNFDSSTSTLRLTNCVIEGSSTGGATHEAIASANSNQTNELYNCTIHTWGNAAIEGGTSGIKVVNCIVDNAYNDFNGTLTGTHNASDDGDGPGTDITPSGSSWSNELETAWTDLRPLDSGNIYHAGEVQNNEANVPSEDIDGNARPTGASAPTIGAFELAAGTTYTLTAAGGTYTLTGTAATLEYHRALVAAAGSYALSGTDANLELHRLLAAGAGAYTLSGTDANLEYHRLLDATAGSYTLTGSDVTLTYTPVGGYSLTAESGSYALTGTAATLTHDFVLSADAGNFTLAGTTAALLFHRVLAAAGGAYTLTGSDATLTYVPTGAYILTCESGTYAISGTDTNFLRTYIMPVDPGTYTISGTDADLLIGRVLAAAGGTYTLTGTAASFLRDYNLTCDGGTYTLTGSAVTLTYSGYVLPNGMITISFTVSQPGVAMSASKPGITITAS